jgi:hypothetical protein
LFTGTPMVTSRHVDVVQTDWAGLPDGLDGDVAAAVAPFMKWWGAV